MRVLARKQLSREWEGQVKFIKVNVQTAYVGVQIRSMPTFHFYVQGKLEHQFSGADENGMRQAVAQIARKAEAMDIELSLGALEAFYQKHDPSKLNGVDEIYEKYPAYKVRRAHESRRESRPPRGGAARREPPAWRRAMRTRRALSSLVMAPSFDHGWLPPLTMGASLLCLEWLPPSLPWLVSRLSAHARRARGRSWCKS